jgi:hypothetical protein
MKVLSLQKMAAYSLALSMTLVACSKDDDDDMPKINQVNDSKVETPATYEFQSNGSSSVSYSGQTDRLNQVAEMKAYIQQATDDSTSISEQALIDMFRNTGGNGNGNFSFTSTKQLENKTFINDQQYFLDLFQAADLASDSITVQAADGKAGILTRSSGSKFLVDTNGHEFTQAIEKGLMGATFFYQITSVYLSEDKIGAAVNNTDLESGKNYTAMEHHMDEAFGYVGAPVDFESNYNGTGTLRYWGKYSNSHDNLIDCNDNLMNAFKTARAAITAKEMDVKDEQVVLINAEMERIAAASAIHYINEAIQIGNSSEGDRIHVLSDAYYFLKALKYASVEHRRISAVQVNTLLNTFGMNMWQVSTPDLNQVKSTLSSIYGFESVEGQL